MKSAVETPCGTPSWNEGARLAALATYGILDTEREPSYDALAELASDIFEAPIAVINLIADGRQWFKAEIGIGQRELPLDVSICRHAILQPGVFVVPDLTEDVRFVDNPLVTAAGGLRFYAGALLETSDGLPLGTVCVLDDKPRPDGISPYQERALRTLAVQVMELLARRRSDAELRVSEARLSAIFANAAVGLSEIALDGRFLRVNDALCAMLGRTRDDLLKADVASVTYEEDVSESRVRLAQVVETGTPVSFDKRYIRPDGELVWASSSLSRLDDSLGHAQTILAVTVDLTDRHSTEDALREQEERLRLATEHAEIGFWDVDEVVQRLIWPPRVKAMFGISADVPVSMDDFYAGLHPDDAAATALAYLAAADPLVRALYDVEYRTIGKEDGVVRWVHAKGRGVFDQRGRCLRVIGTAIDVTERKRIEEQLRELNTTLEARIAERTAERDRTWNNARDLLIVLQADGVIRMVNPAWTDILGWSADELVGRQIFEFIHPDDNLATEAARAAAAQAPLSSFSNRYRHKHGSYHWISWVAAPEGDLIYANGRDITLERQREQELQAAQEALRQSQKMEAMGQLTGGVAHDFNNLLTPIVGSLDMLRRKRLGGEREQRLIDGAIQSADRAKTLVQRLLSFARRQPLKASAVDITKLVSGMADLIRSTTGPQINVVVDLEAGLPLALADANQLEMALLNLAVNARDAMPVGGTLRISAGDEIIEDWHPTNLKAGRYVHLSVADTGVGMDEATRMRALEPFFSTKGIGKGTGLGLSSAHGLASQLGGALTITSQVGVGTNVEIWIPVSSEPLREEQLDTATSALPFADTVLLVDDDQLVRSSTADMLGSLGYEVIEAVSAEHALQLIDSGSQPGLVLTDHLMSGMTGAELLTVLKLKLPNTLSLLVSGYANVDGIAPDLPRLTKPFTSDELVTSLAGLQSKRSIHDEQIE